jgi:hypothetical protein
MASSAVGGAAGAKKGAGQGSVRHCRDGSSLTSFNLRGDYLYLKLTFVTRPMNNFTLSLTKFWKILTITCCLAMLLGVGYWIFTEFTQMDLSTERAVVMGVMGLILSGIFIYGILSTVYDKVIFTADEIQFVRLFRTKVLKKSSIISYSIVGS